MTEKIERIRCGNVNAFLISRGENAVLVDTGQRKYRQKVLDACRPYKTRLLVLTHGHIDHAENAAFLSEALDIPAAMHPADLPLLADNLSQPLSAGTLPGKAVLAASVSLMKKTSLRPFSPALLLKEGDSLEEYGISAKIWEVPGHTDGSIAIDVAGEALIVGDALMNLFYPTASMLYHDREKMEESARRLRGAPGRIIYFGHGKPLNKRS